MQVKESKNVGKIQQFTNCTSHLASMFQIMICIASSMCHKLISLKTFDAFPRYVKKWACGDHKRTKKCFRRMIYVCVCVFYLFNCLNVYLFVVFITPSSFWPIFHCTIKWIITHICTTETLILRLWHCFGHFIVAPQTSKSRCKQFIWFLFGFLCVCLSTNVISRQKQQMCYLKCVFLLCRGACILLLRKLRANRNSNQFNESKKEMVKTWVFVRWFWKCLNFIFIKWITACIIELIAKQNKNSNKFLHISELKEKKKKQKSSKSK